MYRAEPLLERVMEDRTNVATPIIDSIDEKTLEYEVQTDGHYDTVFYLGGFKWTGHFDWIPIPEREKKRKEYNHLPTKVRLWLVACLQLTGNTFGKLGHMTPE